MGAEGVSDHQLAAVILVGFADEQGGGEVCTDPMGGAGHRPDRSIDVVAIGLTVFVAVEQWRHYFERQRG